MAKPVGFYEQFPYPRSHSHGAEFRQYLCRLVEEIFRGRAQPVNVLDAGCGTGAVTRLLVELLPGAHLAGVDQSASSIRIAKNLSLRNVEFRRRNLCNGLGWYRQFDLAFCHGGLRHLDRVKAALTTLVGSLAKNGLLHIWLYSRHGRVGLRSLTGKATVLSARSTHLTYSRIRLTPDIQRLRTPKRFVLDKAGLTWICQGSSGPSSAD